jgi:predicted acyltransferase
MTVSQTPAGQTRAASSSGRLPFVDAARALAVVAMLFANLVNVLLAEPPLWLTHNAGDRLLPLDLPAPIFQFLIGVSLALFLVRRGRGVTARHAQWLAARRFALLVLLGAVLDGIWMHVVGFRWGVLQTLGVGGLLATALAGTPDWVVLTAAGAIVVTHLGPGNNEVHRSLVDCLPFVPLTLAGYVLGRPLAIGDHATFRRRACGVMVFSFTLAAGLRIAGIPFNKVTGTSSFVAYASGASALLLGGLHELEARGWAFPTPLTTLGANALTAWVLQYVLVYYPVGLTLGHALGLAEAPGIASVTATVAVLSALTLALARRGVRIHL